MGSATDYKSGPSLLVRFIWWLFVGWWASGIAVNWGDLVEGNGNTNVAVHPGETSIVRVELGQIRVRAADNTSIQVFGDKLPADGDSEPTERVDYGNPDNTGYWTSDLTSGTYAVRIGDVTIRGIQVTANQVTDIP